MDDKEIIEKVIKENTDWNEAEIESGQHSYDINLIQKALSEKEKEMMNLKEEISSTEKRMCENCVWRESEKQLSELQTKLDEEKKQALDASSTMNSMQEYIERLKAEKKEMLEKIEELRDLLTKEGIDYRIEQLEREKKEMLERIEELTKIVIQYYLE